jgi:acetyl-CoA decarbonylase/synthase complex subunit gamma
MMALSGLDIFKLLPKTNCGDCGVPTCMAFAMKLAQKKAELSECPHASEEAAAAIGTASEAGNETVMFRHEKTFFHPTGVAIQLRTSQTKEQLLKKIEEVENCRVERVGEELKADLFFITHDADNPEDLFRSIQEVKKSSSKGIILDCPEENTLKAALEMLGNDRPAIFNREAASDQIISLAKESGASLVLTSASLDDLVAQSQKIREAGVNNIILNLDSHDSIDQLQHNTIIRRSALKNNFKPLGHPLLKFIRGVSPLDNLADAALLTCKYSSIVVLPEYDRAQLFTLLTLRQNIYTDPQKPIQVDAKVYPIGDPTPDSPVFVTTNFSLTYFIVSGEIENSGISAHLVIVDTEGQSVLTAWAAGKFVGEKIAKFIKDVNLEEEVGTRKIIIPGLVSQISGELEENLPGWEVIVGCQEASDIPSFVKNVVLK